MNLIIETHPIILVVYLLQLLILVLFNYVFINCTYKLKLGNNPVYINPVIVDFCINYSITLGVMGTLIAIGIAVSDGKSSAAFTSSISTAFASALITTIIGGVIYGYCFLLNAYLFKIGIRYEE